MRGTIPVAHPERMWLNAGFLALPLVGNVPFQTCHIVQLSTITRLQRLDERTEYSRFVRFCC
jgi:hypothetical protein